MNKLGVEIETAPFDATCKSILRKLKQSEMDKANVPYIIDGSVVSGSEFGHLLKHAGLRVGAPGMEVFRSVLANYAQPKFGPEVGKIGFKLNFDLL